MTKETGPFLRGGCEFICDVPPGARLAMLGDRVIVIAPSIPPSFVTRDGLVPMSLSYNHDEETE